MSQQLQEMPWTCNFTELDRSKLLWVGGKGANLGEMTQKHFPVPPGFCITTRAYEAFIKSGGSQVEEMLQKLESLDINDLPEVRKLGKAMRKTLNGLEIPSEIVTSIRKAWEKQGKEHSYAVRSSATAEDLPDASFAGQQDTYLHIIGADALLDRIRACWASLFTDRAIVYRVQNGFDHRTVALSVVIQQMILPEISGIMFTADPLHQNRNIISIDASFGLGEALVSGKVSADLYKVQKDSLQIIDIQVGDKKQAIWPKADGGVVEEALSDEKRKKQAMSEAQIIELADLGKRIEAAYDSPQDIEWCIAQDQIFIVQSRPITSLHPLLSPLPLDKTLHFYICFNHVQVMLDPIRPLGISVLSLILPFGKEGKVDTHNRFISVSAGRLYLDLTELLRHKLPHKIVPQMLLVISELIAASVKEITQRPRFQKEMKKATKFSLLKTFRTLLLPIAGNLLMNVWLRKPEGKIQKLNEHIASHVAEARSQLDKADLGIQKLDTMFEILGGLFYDRLIKVFMPVIASSFLCLKLLGSMSGRKLDDPLLSEMMRGLEGNITTEMDLQVADLAEYARQTPEIATAIREHPKAGVFKEIKEIAGSESFLNAYSQFMREFGMRGPSEIDITRNRWSEEATPLFQSIAGNLTKKESSQHRKHHASLTIQGDKAAKKLVEEISKKPMGWIKSKIAKRLTRVFRNFMGVREHPKYMMIQFLGLMKEVLLEEATRQVEKGQINEAKDIYYLDLDQVRQMAKGVQKAENGKAWTEVIQERKEQHQRDFKLSPPGVLTSEGEVVVAKIERENLPEGALAGSPASAGIIEGIARVILDPSDAILHDGEILVAPFTDPGWTPLFIHASALVMEVGGLMTHGSVVAREYGIPAVVSLPDATKLIKSGQRIRVNGDQGYVEIIG